MEKIKLLLYCTKSKPRLMINRRNEYKTDLDKDVIITNNPITFNGKIVAECDFEVEEISKVKDVYDDDYIYETPTLNYDELLKKSCLNNNQLEDYLEFNGYAIHIKNLNIFDKARELNEFYSIHNINDSINRAPQNMCKVFELFNDGTTEEYILISIRPQWLCKILNGEKTIEVRKKVLKEII